MPPKPLWKSVIDGSSSEGEETKRLLHKLFGNGRRSKHDIPSRYLADSSDDDSDSDNSQDDAPKSDHENKHDEPEVDSAAAAHPPPSPSHDAVLAKLENVVNAVQNDPAFQAAGQSTEEAYDEAVMMRHLNEIMAKRFQHRPKASEIEMETEKQWLMNQQRQQLEAEERAWADRFNQVPVAAKPIREEIPDRFKHYTSSSNLHEAASSRPHDTDLAMRDRLNNLFMTSRDKMALASMSQPDPPKTAEEIIQEKERINANIRTARRDQILQGFIGKYMREVDQIVHSTDSSRKIDRKVQKLAAQFSDKHLGKLYTQYTVQENQTPDDWGSFRQQAYKYFDDRKAQALREKNIETAPFLKHESDDSDSDGNDKFQTPMRAAPRSSTSKGSGTRVRELVETFESPPPSRSTTQRGSASARAPRIQEEEEKNSSGDESDGDESSSPVEIDVDDDAQDNEEAETAHPEMALVEVMVRSREALRESGRQKLSTNERIQVLNDFLSAIERRYGDDERRVPEFQFRPNGTIQWGQKRTHSYFDTRKKLVDKINELNKSATKNRSRSRRG